ncbi:unnamed protein product [Lota lota]
MLACLLVYYLALKVKSARLQQTSAGLQAACGRDDSTRCWPLQRSVRSRETEGLKCSVNESIAREKGAADGCSVRGGVEELVTLPPLRGPPSNVLF